MSDQAYRMKDGENIPVEPTGLLAAQGWMAGTWAKWSNNPLTFSGALGTVDLSDGTGTLAGWLMSGPQLSNPMEELSDMWRIDMLQREGGEVRQNFGATDAGAAYYLDPVDKLVNRVGNRIVQLFIPPTGYHRFYVFETQDLAERTTPGTGSPLAYLAGEKLYVSNRGRLTSEMESPSHTWTGYVIARYNQDFEGMYIIAVAASA